MKPEWNEIRVNFPRRSCSVLAEFGAFDHRRYEQAILLSMVRRRLVFRLFSIVRSLVFPWIEKKLASSALRTKLDLAKKVARLREELNIAAFDLSSRQEERAATSRPGREVSDVHDCRILR